MFRLFFIIITLVYLPLSFYIGRRLWQTLRSFVPSANKALYWALFCLLASSFFLSRSFNHLLPVTAGEIITIIGYYWLVAMFYLTLLFIFIDFVRLTGKVAGGASRYTSFNPYTGVAAVILVVIVLVYGSWNARNPRVVHYDLTIHKEAGSLQQLHAVMVSDIHLGGGISQAGLQEMVEMINGLEPDVVLLPGDIVQESGPEVEQMIMDTFGGLRSKFGSYAALGNHEYYGGRVKDIVNKLEEAGLHVLRDSCVKVADSFYLIGREDRSGNRSAGTAAVAGRKDLSELLSGIDKNLPLIVLDHQPVELEAAQKEGVDLQLSGHTHGGQVFPINLITSRMYEQDWGYLQKDPLQLIVSCGIGMWGPPLRIGSIPEVVDIMISFE